MATRRARFIGFATLLLLGACDAENAEDEVTQRELQSNGFQLNGFQLNGFQLNGDGGSSIVITKISMTGGDKGNLSWLTGSQLSIQGKKGVVSTGSALASTVIRYDVNEGGKGKKGREVKIVGVNPLTPGSDIMLYNLQVNSSGWQPLCEDATEAILLDRVWDPATGERKTGTTDAVTFACRGAALAKCVEFGYRPWASVNGVSLREHHQTCTRMVRADYCGEGISHTTNGTPIHVLDKLGIQNVSASTTYVVEAEWGPDGATCLNVANMRHAGQVLGCDLPACGTSFNSGGLIQSGKVL